MTEQVCAEIADGHGMHLRQAAKIFEPYRQNRPVSLGCILRWILTGVRGPDGKRVRLEGAKLPHGWLTTKQAIARFLAAQTPRLDGAEAPKVRTPTARSRATARAERELAK